MSKKLNIFLVAATILISFALGAIYAIFNNDAHHWPFIAGTALDFIAGKHFFTSIFIQYGVGQALIFSILHWLMPINMTSVGIVTCLFYAGTLSAVYVTASRYVPRLCAAVALLVAFFFQPFAVYPWPDFFAGFFLSLACAVAATATDQSPGRRRLMFGALLFTAFLCRNTYMASLVGAATIYLLSSLLFRQLRSRFLWQGLAWFGVFTGLYLASLYVDGTFQDWQMQVTGKAYGGDFIQPWSPYYKMLYPASLNEAVFSIVFCANLLALGSLFYVAMTDDRNSKKDLKSSVVHLYFIACIGLLGPVQSSHYFETWRLQNAASPVYVTSAYIWWRYWRLVRAPRLVFLRISLVAIPCLLIAASLTDFPSLYWRNLPLRYHPLADFGTSTAPFYAGHLLASGERRYYDQLATVLCQKRAPVYNLTYDSSIPYLCGDARAGWPIPFFNAGLYRSYFNIGIEQIRQLHDGELVVSDLPMDEVAYGLRYVAEFQRPKMLIVNEASVYVYSVIGVGRR